jgi:glycosyltransferase involved in cell wall biosynthesis
VYKLLRCFFLQRFHSSMKNILFISYDGLLDPLGASQILPYIKSIAADQGKLVVLSFEKPNRYFQGQVAMFADLDKSGIDWWPLLFTTRLGLFGKLWDLVRMYLWAVLLSLRNEVVVVHARGHIPAQVGCFIKWILGARLIFDCRGLWVDERIDKGSWNMNHLIHQLLYRYLKRVESKLFAVSDQVVVLTCKVVDEVIKLGALPASKVMVIPCCADFDHFPLKSSLSKKLAREITLIPQDAQVLGYLGSVGRMYMLDHFFRFFAISAHQNERCYALVITQDVEQLKQIMIQNLPLNLHRKVHIRTASRAEVPYFLPAMDALVSFILPSYARMASSPTKLAECFAVGIPVICNDGVGDVATQVQELGAGIIIDLDIDSDLSEVALKLDEIFSMGGQRLRNAARPVLGLEVAVERYRHVYSKLN